MTVSWDSDLLRARLLRDHLNYHHSQRGLPGATAVGLPILERLHERLPHRLPLGHSHARFHAEIGSRVTGPVKTTPPRARPPRSIPLHVLTGGRNS